MTHGEEAKMHRRRVPFVALFLLAADQAAKLYVERRLPLNGEQPLWSGMVALTRIHNPGMAMGWMENAIGVVLVASLAAVLGLLFFWISLPVDCSPSPAAIAPGLSCLLGGSAGNTLDRLCRGYVIDFIGLPIGLTVNLADLMLALGGVLLARALWTASEAPAARLTASNAEPTRRRSQAAL
jgi:signal peptidase II